jgi:ribonuclease HI
MIKIYTDGSCKSNGNKEAIGGLGVVFIDGDKVIHTHHQTFSHTTNNRMEYKSMIYGMQWCVENSITNPHFVSDSKLLLDTVQTWMFGWEKKGWRKAGSGAGAKIKNLDLVLELWELKKLLPKATFEWVKGHSGDMYNEMADELTNMLEFETAIEDKTNIMILREYMVEANLAPRTE